jgi:hypothetical protein
MELKQRICGCHDFAKAIRHKTFANPDTANAKDMP